MSASAVAAIAITAPRRENHEDGSVLSQLLRKRKEGLGLAVLLAKRDEVPQMFSQLADEYRRHPRPKNVLKRLRRLHTLDAALAHVSTTYYQDPYGALDIVRSLYAIFGYHDVCKRMQAMKLEPVLELMKAPRA